MMQWKPWPLRPDSDSTLLVAHCTLAHSRFPSPFQILGWMKKSRRGGRMLENNKTALVLVQRYDLTLLNSKLYCWLLLL